MRQFGLCFPSLPLPGPSQIFPISRLVSPVSVASPCLVFLLLIWSCLRSVLSISSRRLSPGRPMDLSFKAIASVACGRWSPSRSPSGERPLDGRSGALPPRRHQPQVVNIFADLADIVDLSAPRPADRSRAPRAVRSGVPTVSRTAERVLGSPCGCALGAERRSGRLRRREGCSGRRMEGVWGRPGEVGGCIHSVRV